MGDIEALSGKHGLRIPCYGHAGDGNLHATLLMPADMQQEDWRELKKRVLTELYMLAAKQFWCAAHPSFTVTKDPACKECLLLE